MAQIEGNCDPRFGRVKAAFAENFDQRNEYGAAVAVSVDGKMVVDLWGGHRQGAHAPMDARHDRHSVFDHQGDDRDMCSSPGRQGPP